MKTTKDEERIEQEKCVNLGSLLVGFTDCLTYFNMLDKNRDKVIYSDTKKKGEKKTSTKKK